MLGSPFRYRAPIVANDPQWTPPTEAQLAAANEVVDSIVEAFRSDRGVHAETAVAAASRIAGTFLFRSFGFDFRNIQPGSPVLSDAANERGPLLLRTLGTALVVGGVNKSALTVVAEIPDEHRPHLSIAETQTRIEATLRAIASRHGLSQEQAAHACALAAARLIKMCADVLEPRIGFALATRGFVEGTKTVPAALPEDPAAAS